VTPRETISDLIAAGHTMPEAIRLARAEQSRQESNKRASAEKNTKPMPRKWRV